MPAEELFPGHGLDCKSQITYTMPGRQWQEAPCSPLAPNKTNWQGGSHGYSLYWAYTTRIGCWRWILGSQWCGPIWTQNSKTSEGFASQIGTLLHQGVRRSPAILACKWSDICQVIRKFPSVWLFEVIERIIWFNGVLHVEIFVQETFFPRQNISRSALLGRRCGV